MQRQSAIFTFTKKDKLLQWASSFTSCVILDSFQAQNIDYPHGFSNDLIIGVGTLDELISMDNSFEKLKAFHQKHQDWILGYLSYDLKNESEGLTSTNDDRHSVAHMHFVVPETVLLLQEYSLTILSASRDAQEIFAEINAVKVEISASGNSISIHPRISHTEYLKGVESLLHHIQAGDIYEANYCQEFFAEQVEVNPFHLYSELTKISPTPFSAYLHFGHTHLMCASPERFLKKTGRQILSQPIKGTARRGANEEEDRLLKENLRNSPKNRSENVMIVDLVRNDLSRTARQESVKVEELFGVYSFSNVHQMISTISSEIDEKFHFTDVLKNAFPMGSMTGAPKIMAMKLIEKYEVTQRGLYSGSVGYITPKGDFDFNVVIRSVQYNAASQYLSYMVGGAITHKSIPEEEFAECEIKAAAIKKVLQGM